MVEQSGAAAAFIHLLGVGICVDQTSAFHVQKTRLHHQRE
jgi:hypothetical protein